MWIQFFSISFDIRDFLRLNHLQIFLLYNLNILNLLVIDLELLRDCSGFFPSFQKPFFYHKPDFDIESKLWVLGFIKGIHSDRARRLKNVRKKNSDESLSSSRNTSENLTNSSGNFFSKFKFYSQLKKRFSQRKNRKVMSLNRIVSKIEECMSTEQLFSRSKHLPPTTLSTSIQI